MKARYFVRVRLATHWSTFCVVGPGQGSRAVALRVRDLLLEQPGWEWPVRVDPTSRLGPMGRHGERRKIERAIIQSEVEWDADDVADILRLARAGRRRDRIGLMPKRPRAAKRYNHPPSLDGHPERKKPHA